MNIFKPIEIASFTIKDSVLTIGDNSLFNTIMDEFNFGENIRKIVFESSKYVDFAVIIRGKHPQLEYEFAPFTKGRIMFMFENEEVQGSRVLTLQEDVNLEIIVPDFNKGNRRLNIETKLMGTSSSVEWKLSSFAELGDKKVFNISFSHFGVKSYANMENYGVVLNNSTLIFSGDSTIFDKVKDAETHQTARIIVFDEGSYAEADPKLNIYYNDVIAASHAATVGRVNSDHLYYLKTRGLNEKEAKKLITKGYLMPILAFVSDDALKESFTQLLEEVI